MLNLLFLRGCIVEYIPATDEEQELLVVDGIITDQPGINTIRLAKSIPLWGSQVAKPLKGCMVWLSDDLGDIDSLKETVNGKYITDSASFKGETGRVYTLHIRINSFSGYLNYESFPVKMIPVPPVDTIYYEKETFDYYHIPYEGCNIYLDTYDPANICNFYRWKYSETWEFRVPFDVPSKVCWKTENSGGISIKNTSILEETRITRHPVITITNPIDRLTVKYSILVSQYSMNEDEYLYWDRLKNTLDQIGGLYDLIPAYIPNNIYCVENPNEKILGYFSVSAVSSRRLFIKDNFKGLDVSCMPDTIYGTGDISGLNSTVWVIIDHTDQIPPYKVIANNWWCGDCTKTGTNIKPSFWDEDK